METFARCFVGSSGLHFEAAGAYWARGWIPLALGLDAQGFPKRPLGTGGTNIGEDWELQPWAEAKGIGILLGPASGNLAAVDVDDGRLAGALLPQLSGKYHVRTVRGRLHIYVVEQEASPSRKFQAEYEGRTITVELKGQGTQVAAPPTAGYTLLGAGLETVHSVGLYWQAVAAGLLGKQSSEAYPRPWRTEVGLGERNKAMFVEALRLAEAGVPYLVGQEMLRDRYQRHYRAGEDAWAEYERTIKSAYRRAGRGSDHRGDIDRVSCGDTDSGRPGTDVIRGARADAEPPNRGGRVYLGGSRRAVRRTGYSAVKPTQPLGERDVSPAA